MQQITIDAVAGISIASDTFANECRTLKMLSAGLLQIANYLKQRESRWEQQTGGKVKMTSYGCDFDGTTDALNLIACMFHWFGVSACNYGRLVGFIRGMSIGDFNRHDLSEPAKFKAVQSSVDDYFKGVSELNDVLIWRNKVAAHFAMTAPHKSDNLATLDVSVMFPVTFTSGKYRVGEISLRRKNSTGVFVSELPAWSVTEVFERLVPRYWPNLQLQSEEPGAST